MNQEYSNEFDCICVISFFKLALRAKVSKYGDRLLEAIETTINEYYATNKQSLKDMNSR